MNEQPKGFLVLGISAVQAFPIINPGSIGGSIEDIDNSEAIGLPALFPLAMNLPAHSPEEPPDTEAESKPEG